MPKPLHSGQRANVYYGFTNDTGVTEDSRTIASFRQRAVHHLDDHWRPEVLWAVGIKLDHFSQLLVLSPACGTTTSGTAGGPDAYLEDDVLSLRKFRGMQIDQLTEVTDSDQPVLHIDPDVGNDLVSVLPDFH